MCLERALKIEDFKKKVNMKNHVFNPLILFVKEEIKNNSKMVIKII